MSVKMCPYTNINKVFCAFQGFVDFVKCIHKQSFIGLASGMKGSTLNFLPIIVTLVFLKYILLLPSKSFSDFQSYILLNLPPALPTVRQINPSSLVKLLSSVTYLCPHMKPHPVICVSCSSQTVSPGFLISRAFKILPLIKGFGMELFLPTPTPKKSILFLTSQKSCEYIRSLTL